MLKIAFLVLTVVLIAVVWARGRAEERWTAGVLVVASIASPLVEAKGFVGLEVGIMAIDVGLFGFLLALAVRSDRFWPLWAAGFQLVCVLVHIARMAHPNVWFLAYSNATIFWAYPVYLALIIGTLTEARNRTR